MESIEYKRWLENLQSQQIPTWDALPDLDLYMDQVVTEVNKIFTPILQTTITKAMINSYVKNNMVQRPIKKKYQRQQLVEIILISIMKVVFPLDTVKKGVAKQLDTDKEHTQLAYDNFVERFNQALAGIDVKNPVVQFQQAAFGVPDFQQMAIQAVIYKIICMQLIEIDGNPISSQND